MDNDISIKSSMYHAATWNESPPSLAIMTTAKFLCKVTSVGLSARSCDSLPRKSPHLQVVFSVKTLHLKSVLSRSLASKF